MKKLSVFFNRLKFPKKVGNRQNYLDPPNYTLREQHFLIQEENFFSGTLRALRIFFEYMKGFYAFSKVHNCITIFGSARFKSDHPYYHMARVMGHQLAEAGFTVMTGGGPGIMEAANRGAKEAGGTSVGCNIELAEYEIPNDFVDYRIKIHYFFVRKVMLTKYSVAFIVMPGGLGTLDELFEVTTLIQNHKLRNFPVILMGKKFWQPLIDFMRDTLLKQSTISKEDLDEMLITDSPDEVLHHIENYLTRNNHPR